MSIKKSVLFFFLFCLGLIVLPTPVLATDPTVVINELMINPSSGNSEWVELFNYSQDSIVDLSGMTLVVTQGDEPNYTYRKQITL